MDNTNVWKTICQRYRISEVWIRNVVVAAIVLSLLPAVSAQSGSDWEKGKKAEKHNNFTAAIKAYKKAFNAETAEDNRKVIAYRIAGCYAAMNNFTASFPWYEDAIGPETKNIEYYIDYGDALARSGNIKKSVKILETGLSLSPDHPLLTRKINAFKAADKAKKEEPLFNIGYLEFLNTEFSEFGPGWMEGRLVFASTRLDEDNNRIDGRTGQGYSNLYVSVYDDEKQHWSPPEKFEGAINSRFNDGTFAYDPVMQTGYTMQCNENLDNCRIISAVYNEDENTWTDPEKITFDIHTFSIGHPSLNKDASVMYFVSDLSGGYGGKDIWKVNKKPDGSWGLPINLGEKINTPGDEMFPFILGDSILVFASDEHPGFGGLDLFYSMKKDFEFQPPVNMGYLFNGSSDDFGMIIKEDLLGGVFCTNRKTTSGDDLYAFDDFPLLIRIQGKITDASNHRPIPISTIVIRKNKETKTLTSDQQGKYKYFGLMPYETYEVEVEKEGYHPEKRIIELDTKQLNEIGHILELDFELTRMLFTVAISGKVVERTTQKLMPGETVEIMGSNGYHSITYTDEMGKYRFDELKPENDYTVKVSKEDYFSEARSCKVPRVTRSMTFSKETGHDLDFELTKIEKKKEIVLNNIYYDFDKATLRPESKTELNKLASMLTETPGVAIQISSHTDNRGSDTYNKKLSDKRAASVVSYLISQGIDKSRLISKGYGEENLLITNASTEDEHQQNRRTTFKVTEVGEDPQAGSGENDKLEYRIQLMSTREPIPGGHLFREVLDKIPNTHVFVNQSDGMFKYEIGSRKTLKEAQKLKKKLVKIGYEDCFLNAYSGGKKITMEEAKRLEAGS